MLSLIRADGTDRRLPSANSVDLVARPMAVLVSSRTVSRGGQPLRCSYCVRRLLFVVFHRHQDEELTRGKEEASAENLRIRQGGKTKARKKRRKKEEKSKGKRKAR